MPKIFGNRFGNVSQADGYLDDKKSVYNLFDQYFSTRRVGWFSKVTASGGTEITTDDYKYHVFLSPGTLTVTVGGRVDYLVVGNGGNGRGATPGGGGGAGGLRTGTNYSINSPQTVTVGGPTGSAFGLLTASNGTSATSPNGSGGDSGSPTTFPGGTGSPSGGGGGGGGSSAAGANAVTVTGGKGGDGIAVPWANAPTISPAIPAPVQPTWIPAVGPLGYYAGGGGGSGRDPSPPYVAAGGAGGLGGGGRGSTVDPSPFTTIEPSTGGVTYTGSGGGGGSGAPGNISGGTGIVIIRYRI